MTELAESEATAREQALVGQVLAERYRVDRLLGSGGMGSVYLAEHVLMKKPVALKVLHPEMTEVPEVVARFEREAVAAARIDHPNVAAATDFGQLPDGSFYLVLEYIDGKSLSSVLEGGPLELDRALVIGVQIGIALSAAHAVGIVHRDLKPDNVMLVPAPEGHEAVKVLDFGIAKVQGAEEKVDPTRPLTRIGTVMGTAGYMSPEQALGQAVDARADLYALGVVLYEMVAGQPPYVAEEAGQILAKQLTDPVPPFPAGTPEPLSRLIASLLEKNVAARPADVTAIVQELIQIRESLTASSAAFLAESGLGSGAADVPASARQRSSPPDSAGSGRRIPLAALVAGVLGVAGVIFWATRSSEQELADEPPLPSAAAPAAPAPAAKPTSGGRTDGPGTVPGASESTAPAEKPAATTPRAEKRTTKRSTTKRKTGPGGIYIPPPSEWFK